MEFITWWFDTHYIASTIITPGMTFAWCCYKGLLVRGLIAFILWGGIRISSRGKE